MPSAFRLATPVDSASDDDRSAAAHPTVDPRLTLNISGRAMAGRSTSTASSGMFSNLVVQSEQQSNLLSSVGVPVAAPTFAERTGGLASSSAIRSSLQLMMPAANQLALGTPAARRHPLRSLSNTPLTSTPVSSISGYSSDSSSDDSENEQMIGELSDFSELSDSEQGVSLPTSGYLADDESTRLELVAARPGNSGQMMRIRLSTPDWI